MRRGSRLPAAAVAAAAAVGAGCVAAYAADAGTTATRVKVVEKEFVVKPTPARAKPGRVTFSVRNTGKVAHEFVVLRTKIAPGKLPTKGAVAVEKGRIGEIADIPAGKTKKLSVRLKAGKYVLICNLPGHYKAGQYAGFRVVR